MKAWAIKQATIHRTASILLIVIPTCCGLAILGAVLTKTFRPPLKAQPAPVATQRPAQPATSIKFSPATQPATITSIPPSPIPSTTHIPTQPATLQAATRSPATTAAPFATSLPTIATPSSIPTAAPRSVPIQSSPTNTPRPISTAAPTSTPRPTSITASASLLAAECPCDQGNVLNCPDFLNPAQAQACYLKCGGPTRDVHGLDRDGDGLACEPTPSK